MARGAADVLAVCCRRAAGIGPSRRGGKEAGESRGGRWRSSQGAGRAGKMLQTPWRASFAVDDAGDVGTLGELRGLVVKTESSSQ